MQPKGHMGLFLWCWSSKASLQKQYKEHSSMVSREEGWHLQKSFTACAVQQVVRPHLQL
jgi:hypothetical protein